MSELLQLQVRHKAYGGRTVLQDVAVQLQPGEVVALVGASGCGKSTLLRIASGLDLAYSGQVRLGGQAVQGPVQGIRFVFQEPRLFPWLSVARNVAFESTGGRPNPARVQDLLAAVGLEGLGQRLPKELSGGQAQRVAIARSLYVNPRLLLLDEPFSAVDAFTRLKLQEMLLHLVRAQGIGVLMVTHDIDEAVHLADRVLVLQADPGRIVADLAVALPHPRPRETPAVTARAARVRAALEAAHAF